MNIENLKEGDEVKYSFTDASGIHSSEGHQVTYIDPMPNNFGCDVAWVTGKSDCVDVNHLELM